MNAWREYRFSDFVDIAPKVSLHTDSAYSFVEMADLKDGNKFCEASEIRQFNGSGTKFENNDTLFARITPCLENGKICQVRNLSDGKGFGSTEFHVFRGKEGLSDSDFVFYLARWPEIRDFAEANFHGTSGRQRVPRESFDNLMVTLPPVVEQRAIASVLSSLDDKIDLLHRQNNTLEGIASTLWRKMFIEDADPTWPIKEIGEVANRIQYGLTQSATTDEIGPKFLRITDIQGGTVNWDTVPYCFATEEEFTKYKLNTGDIVVARTGASTGENLFIQTSQEAVFASYLVRLQFSGLALSRYISIHMRSSEYLGYIEGILSGSAQPNANAKQLTSFRVQLPPCGLLDEFYSCIKHLDEKRSAISGQIRTLSHLRDNLLPKLMSGEVRVKL